MARVRSRPERTILVVEDDDDSAALLMSYVERLGHTVLRARTGEDALRMVSLLEPDVAIVDLLLPGLTGWELIAALQSPDSDVHCPIVVCSVLDRQDYPRGVDGVLPKPYTRRQVEQVLRPLLQQGR